MNGKDEQNMQRANVNVNLMVKSVIQIKSGRTKNNDESAKTYM